MLRRLSANDERFKTIRFREGFNVILAERDPNATNQQSRNARGKTSLLLVINYMLGGSLHNSLKPLADGGWEFTLVLDLFGQEVTVTRSLASGSKLNISFPSALQGVLGPYVQEGRIALDDWKDLLGLALFRLEPAPEGSTEQLSPRTLLSYVVRATAPSDPLKIINGQPALSVRKHIAFLVGLDWTIVRELQIVNRQIDDLAAVGRTMRDGVLDSLRPVEQLELSRSAAQNAVDALRARVGEYRVLEDPDEMLSRADALTSEIAVLRDQGYVDQRMESLYVSALSEDVVREGADETEVVGIYEAAGATFSNAALRRLETVQAFRENLLANRRQFLDNELQAVRDRLTIARQALRSLDEQREEMMRALRAGGALDELLAMQSELASLVAEVGLLDAQIDQSREVAVSVDELKAERAQIRTDASQKLVDDRDKLDQLSDRFRTKMKQLYDVDAVISVTVDGEGYLFSVAVASGASSAVSRMRLFCFDLTLLEEGVSTGHHPDFLVHDSSVFDGVDPRQRASALKLANTIASEIGGQYICTINSNDVPEDVAEEDWFVDGTVRTVLDTDEGGLFGLRF